MTRRLIVALIVTLSVGALLDATVLRSSVGLRTVGHDRARWADASGEARDRSVPTLVGTAALLDWYTLPLALRELAPGAEILVDAGASSRRLVPETHLRAIGASRSVSIVDLSDVILPIRAPDVVGEAFWFGPWTFDLAPGRIDTVLIFPGPDSTRLVDARLAPGAPPPTGAALTEQEATSARRADQPPSLVRAVLTESLVYLGLLLIGGLLLSRGRGRHLERLALSLIVGLSLHAVMGMLLLPGLRGLAFTVLTAGTLGVVAKLRGFDFGWTRTDVGALSLAAIGLSVVVAWARWSSFLVLTPDSRDYWSGGALFADGTLTPRLLDVKRGLSQQVLHGTGFSLGIEGLQALGAVMLVAICVLIVTAGSTLGSRPSIGVAAATLLLVVSLVVSPQIRSITAFLSGHALTAALLLALLVLLTSGTASGDDRRPLLDASIPVIAALVLTRAEAPLLVGLLLIGSMAAVSRPRRLWPAWIALAVATGTWAAVLAAGERGTAGRVSISVLALAALAVGALAAALTVVLLSHGMVRRLPFVVSAALWAVALLFLSLEGDRFLDAAVTNLGRGDGRWGVYGVLLLVSAVLVVGLGATSGDPTVVAARWFLIGFVPVTLLAKLGDGLGSTDADLGVLLSGGGRAGWGDSVNRMWFHAVPIILYLVVLLLRGPDQPGPDSTRETRQRTQNSRDAILAALGVWIVLQWQPTFLPITTLQDVEVLDFSGGDSLVEIAEGVRVEQHVDIPPLVVPEDAVPARICSNIVLITYGREVAGAVLIELTSSHGRVQRIVPASEVVDWAGQRICIDLSEGPGVPVGLPRTVMVAVSGLEGRPGASVGVLSSDPQGGSGAVVTLPDGTVALDGRDSGHLALQVLVGLRVTQSGFAGATERIVPVLPWLALLIGVLTIVAARHRTVGGRILPSDGADSAPIGTPQHD